MDYGTAYIKLSYYVNHTLLINTPPNTRQKKKYGCPSEKNMKYPLKDRFLVYHDCFKCNHKPLLHHHRRHRHHHHRHC